MKTVTIQIGNTDNNLTQQRWADFVQDVHDLVAIYRSEIYFFGGPETWARWQNACWVIAIEPGDAIDGLKADLERARADFGQQAIAWTEGETLFI